MNASVCAECGEIVEEVEVEFCPECEATLCPDCFDEHYERCSESGDED